MKKKQFKAESKRLMDLMINSIYTHREIFLREIISNASDAVDKLAYRALTDQGVGMSREDFEILVTVDELARTITVSDNGIGMDKEALEQNLGTIAKSGSYQFKQETEAADGAEVDIIGQFGVGFYSAFMVADKVTVLSRAYGSDEAWRWESEGVEGYTIESAHRDAPGTDVIMTLKADGEEEDYGKYLRPHTLTQLIRKYSDYIRYPIKMEVETRRMKEKPEDAEGDSQPEYETIREIQTINSMVPLWQRPRSQVTAEEYHSFYREKFMDWEEPLVVSHIAAEGNLEYKALVYVPARAPMDYYTADYKPGLQLYSSGVMIMERCEALLPDYFGFVRGVVDSPDVSLNISREMLQHDRQLKVIANNLEKKIKNELIRLMKEEREKYEQFWEAFGIQLKYSVMGGYGANKDKLSDLLLFWSSKENRLTSLVEYRERMPESQQFAYYVVADSVDKAASMPQAERILKAGFEVLYLTAQEDEFLLQVLGELEGKRFLSVASEEALPVTETEKAQVEQAERDHKELLDFVKEILGDRVTAVRVSKILQSGAVCLASDGPVSIEMEQYFKKINAPMPMTAGRVLELNAGSTAFAALGRAYEGDRDKAAKYAELLYNQALLIADLPLENPVRYTELVCSLME
jgi:molecular chaperone HtpG